MEDVGLQAAGVDRPAVGGARLVADSEPVHVDESTHGRPHPGRRHHAQDLPQLEVVAQRLGDGVVLVDADVHQRVDGGHQAEGVQPAVEVADEAGPEDPAALDEGGDGEGHDGQPHQEIGHGQVDQEEVGARAHASVADDHRQHHGVAHHGQEGGDGQDDRQADRVGEVPAVVVVAVLVICCGVAAGVEGQHGGGGGSDEPTAPAVVVGHGEMWNLRVCLT